MSSLLLLFSIVLLHWHSGLIAAEAQKTHCRQEEDILFSCPVKDGTTIVSLCGSKHLTAQEGYLQYRYGRRGHIELEFPAQRQDTQTMFRYAHYSRYQVNRVVVSFQRGGYTYALFDNDEGDILPKTHQQGVQVTPSKAARKEVTLMCRETALGNLHSLSAILPCDKDDPLNMGECQ
jgi:hypothetical protein